MRAAVRARGGRDWEYLPFSSRERVAAGSSGSVSDGGTFERREVIGNQMPARTVLEATLSIGSVHGSYGVGGLDKQSKIVGLFCSEILSFSEVTEY